jgi:hypothetical protein
MNGLVRAVDALCERREWDDLVDLEEKCEAALERGKQLWPIAAHVRYRLALESPGDYAGEVLTSQPERFAPGPLTEVAASTHSWEELAPYIEDPRAAAYVAQERVLRGEELTGDDRAHGEVLELPLVLQSWEPTYALATYRSNHVEVAEPWEPRGGAERKDIRPAPLIDEPEITDALVDLVQPWLAESNGAARAVVVEGDALGAASHLVYGPLQLQEIDAQEALRLIAWAAASGGAHGRRRGAALGRFLSWYTICVLADIDWPADPDQLGSTAGALKWFGFDEGVTEEGWILRVAVELREGLSAAIAATDLLTDES